jgi:hypothetical protein
LVKTYGSLKENKMTKTPGSHKESEYRKQVAEITKRKLFLLIIFLAAISLLLALRAGEGFWPLWMIDYRKQIMGVILLIMVFLMLLSPLIVEVNSNPRALSGPGKDPRGPWDP